MKMLKSKKVKHYDFTKKPWLFAPLILLARFLAWLLRLGRKTKVIYEGVKPKTPSLILINHASFYDFFMMFKTIKTPKINYVSAIDSFNDFTNPLMRSIGCVPKRKFISDLSLMKNMKYSVSKLKNSFVIYPEARYSLDGTTSYLPNSLGKCVKFLKVPLVIVKLCGCYVSDPQWNKYKDKKIPHVAYCKQILTAEEVETTPVEVINEMIKKELTYDDWQYLRESEGVISSENRAYNLNAILYQCPNCKTEFEMVGSGTTLTCKHCNKSWNFDEKGVLTATSGETEFKYVPDWFKWEKQNVHEEVFSGKYKVEMDCKVYTLPSCNGFVAQQNGVLYQDSNGTELRVNLYGEDRVIKYNGNNLESVHLEYQYKGVGDMIDFSIQGDSIWMQPIDRKDIITKISLATEEIRDLAKIK